ncbi:MAG TPA: ABC transporter permease [Candidatus Tectomicrobia bacterium]|nr:ABC transporter permease [Candidatus Tectomicrobia bacterium]
MRRYAVQRVLLFIPAVLGVTLVVFVLMRLIPGDIATVLVYEAGTERAGAAEQAVQKMRRELGLDLPLLVQYLHWLLGAARGDFGYSYWERRPVSETLGERFPRTMQLALMTMVFALCWAIPLGVISAVRQDTPIDYLARLVSISGLSIPAFFVGVLMLFFMVRFFGWMPPLEFTPFFDDPIENLKQLIWPALAEAYYISAPITRLTRSLMLEVIREDYVRTARAKGVTERLVVYHHALRNMLIPLVTFVGWSGGRLLGGVVVMELIFAVPGMGTGLIDAVHHRDYPTVQAIVFMMAMVFLTLNLAVDLLYSWLDPRIRYQQ